MKWFMIVAAVVAIMGGMKSCTDVLAHNAYERGCAIRWPDHKTKVAEHRAFGHMQRTCLVQIGGVWYPSNNVKIGVD